MWWGRAVVCAYECVTRPTLTNGLFTSRPYESEKRAHAPAFELLMSPAVTSLVVKIGYMDERKRRKQPMDEEG